MRGMQFGLRKVFILIHLWVFLLGFGSADEPVASDSSALILTNRDLQQFELANIVLVSTLDGSLQARSRDTGLVLWTLESSPLVDVRETFTKSPSSSQSADSMVTWLAEPSERGGLYYFTPEGGIERIPASVWDLVQKAPFGMVENVVYTGSRQTTLYAIDIKTGEVIQAFGETLEHESAKSTTDPRGIVMIGRTEYTLNIHENVGSPGWRIRIGLWTPNSRDQDLAAQYTGSMDSVYITPLSSNSIMALAENDMRPQRWIGETSSLLISVYDVLKSKPDGYLSLVHQPPLKLSGMETEFDLFVARTPSNVPVVVSGPRYAALLGSAAMAEYCSGTGKNIQGVHPLWCQDKRRAPNSAVPPAISLLPPPTISSYPQYPRIDPPTESESFFVDGGRWPLVKRILENVGMVLMILVLFAICAYQGWLPVDVIAALQRLVGRASRIQSQQQQKTGEEPKKRKRGARGGRRRNNDGNNNGNANENANGNGNGSGPNNNTNEIALKQKGKDSEVVGGDPEKEKDQRDSIPISTNSPITISDTVLGYGSHGTTVFKGRFEGRDVAVKRMLLEFYDVASQEVDMLRESDDHPNVVRYYYKYQTDQFLYIALELCPGTLEDMVRESNQFSIIYEPLEALRQVTRGLQHLHNLQIVHRDIKPQNILVALPTGSRLKNRKAALQTLGVRYLISDFGLCRKLEGEQSSFLPTFADSVAGTAGWAAPEISSQDHQTKPRLTRAVDVFSMGCLFYYVLSGGKHPFGDVHMRQVNIQQRRPPQLEAGGLVTPEAMDLIPRMLNTDPNSRPNTFQILKHPLFWTDQMKLDFLVKISDRLEQDSREEHSDLIDRLEIHAGEVVGNNWHDRFPQIFNSNLGRFRRYHGDRILDLLRALRNKLHHYNDFSDELKECVGGLPSGYLNFFTSRFPHLLMTVYYYAEVEFKGEDAFIPFF